MEDSDVKKFIDRWKPSGGAERANYGLFLTELCDVLGVPHPDPATPDNAEAAYVFERAVTFHHADGSTSAGRIDLYKRGCFVLEAKQGVEKREQETALSEAGQAKAKAIKKGTATRGSGAWDEAMLKARGQAEQYARALPAGEGRPPLLIVVDVGHTIELYSEFTRTGGAYVPYPDPRSYRISLDRLADPKVRQTLALAWTDPQSLDPSRRSAKVTREIAQSLGLLAQSLEKSNSPEDVATFLMRALFTMFAEDVELLPKDSFLNLLKSLNGRPEQFVPMVGELWERMKTGGFSTALREKIRHFNGGLFADATALPLNDDQIGLLIDAARSDWREVEPAIFGTLLERALNPIERHRLGAHYTPRAYVERLVIPTIVEPLRAEWDAVKAAAVTLDRQGKQKEAADVVQKFHRRLCEIRVLDPACGSGNFLYVTLEHLKRLEGEVLNSLDRLGREQAALEMAGFSVDPHQLLGLEVNPRAAAIAELVLWIGYLQWHFRTRGSENLPVPIIKNFHNIECRDAVLDWNRTEPVLDDRGQPVTRWDGRTKKRHPVTGEEVPDETARVPVVKYINPRPAKWPEADFIVGNPPFIGTARMRESLGDGYTEAVREAHSEVGESSDFVMYWWNLAAHLVREGKARCFGFITTNSLKQTFNRRVLEPHLNAKDPLSLTFAIPDHPWVDSADGAQVRIAMTVAAAGKRVGVLKKVVQESLKESSGEVSVILADEHGEIHADLTVGPNVSVAESLRANWSVCGPGTEPHGMAFIVDGERAKELGVETCPGLDKHIRPYLNGRDLTARPRNVFAIDLYGLTIDEVRDRFPAVFQWVFDRVKPERNLNPRPSRRDNWWIFGEPSPQWRKMSAGLPRYIATVKTSKHRFFTFLDKSFLPDSKIIAFAFDDAYFVGVLSCRIHITWALAAGSHLGVGNDPTYVKSASFEAFPFPVASQHQQSRIRELGEALDAHRKRQQAQYPKLTLTDMYNVLEKLRAGTPLEDKEQVIHEQGLVTVLRQLHDDLDAAVAEAYGLPVTASDDEILTFLCALNAQRAAEERNGLVRWLRPAFQHPEATTTQGTLTTGGAEPVPVPAKLKPASKIPWPKTLAEQAQAVRAALASAAGPADAAMVAKAFKGAKVDRLEDILETLASLGQARALPDGRYAVA